MYDPCTVIALFHVVTAKILTFAIFQQIITTSDRQLGQRGPKQNNLRFTFSKPFLLWGRHQVALEVNIWNPCQKGVFCIISNNLTTKDWQNYAKTKRWPKVGCRFAHEKLHWYIFTQAIYLVLLSGGVAYDGMAARRTPGLQQRHRTTQAATEDYPSSATQPPVYYALYPL